MLWRGVQVWLAMLGLLSGLLLTPSLVEADCCLPPDAAIDIGTSRTDAAPEHACCAPAEQQTDDPAPTQDRDGPGHCHCPRACCAVPAQVATLRAHWGAPAPDLCAGAAETAAAEAESSEYHLDLIRPPRS
ncbi:MAG: hypothetical protein ACF8R7_03955 [Phycisphaerales bacterium JB039]